MKRRGESKDSVPQSRKCIKNASQTRELTRAYLASPRGQFGRPARGCHQPRRATNISQPDRIILSSVSRRCAGAVEWETQGVRPRPQGDCGAWRCCQRSWRSHNPNCQNRRWRRASSFLGCESFRPLSLQCRQWLYRRGSGTSSCQRPHVSKACC